MVAKMPALNKKAFIFSTSGASINRSKPGFHKKLRESLQSKGLEVIDEFSCPGYDTFIFVRIGTAGRGVSRGRPNEEDLNKARKFADNLKIKVGSSLGL
jgi:hypothetical protein